MASDEDSVICSICNKPFHYPKSLREADRGFAKAIDGQTGETCEECSEIIVGGSPEQLDGLVASRDSPPSQPRFGDCDHVRLGRPNRTTIPLKRHWTLHALRFQSS
ncbi:hypothetical protein GOB57_21770 [Sinorhizobium meliloti]|nr:hypothetical protein [Sinorhizobium meliloti]